MLGATALPSFEQVHRLRYVTQVLNESLRLWPTAPGFTRAPFEDTVIGGRYAIPAGTPITTLIPMLHRDQSVWGPDAEEFDPDHVASERLAALRPNAFKPFGTGQRACIGRQFALQEATLVLGMLLQRFEFVDHGNYELKIKTTLTIKPDDFRIRVRRRADRPIDHPIAAPASADGRITAGNEAPAVLAVERHGTPLSVLYGSNLGTAEGIATKLAREGTERGFAVTVGALDDHVGDLPADGATIVVCASYNGMPPENATRFCSWLRDPATATDACAGAGYTVFGCGNSEWATTYQAVPTLLDTQLEAHGARRLHPRGEGDARSDFDAQYRSWYATLWSDLAGALQLPASVAAPAATGPRLSVSILNRQLTNPVIMSYRARPAVIRANRELNGVGGTRPANRSTRHIDVALPAGTTYRTGDHLGVLPRNSIDLIQRVMRRFTLDAGMYLTIMPNSGSHSHLPIDEPAPLLGVLGCCVELQDVATRSDIETMARYTEDAEQRAALQALAGDDEESHRRYRERVFTPYRSILDLLEEFPACSLPFEVYLDLLPPLRPRYYSISSSPLVSPDICSITTGVLRAPARGGDGEFHGICSTHLSLTAPNSTVFAFVREPTIAFRPPDDPSVPMIMVGAGTGLAPFRGFLQDRAAVAEQGASVAPSMLFFGCREPEQDELYGDELRELTKLASTTLCTVFSNRPHDGRRYVQHEMLARADEVWDLIERGAAIFVCGNANTMAPGVRAALVDIYRQHTGRSSAEAQDWLTRLRVRGPLPGGHLGRLSTVLQARELDGVAHFGPKPPAGELADAASPRIPSARRSVRLRRRLRGGQARGRHRDGVAAQTPEERHASGPGDGAHAPLDHLPQQRLGSGRIALRPADVGQADPGERGEPARAGPLGRVDGFGERGLGTREIAGERRGPSALGQGERDVVGQAEAAGGGHRRRALGHRGAQVVPGFLQPGPHQASPAAEGLVVDERAAPQHLPARRVGEVEITGGERPDAGDDVDGDDPLVQPCGVPHGPGLGEQRDRSLVVVGGLEGEGEREASHRDVQLVSQLEAAGQGQPSGGDRDIDVQLLPGDVAEHGERPRPHQRVDPGPGRVQRLLDPAPALAVAVGARPEPAQRRRDPQGVVPRSRRDRALPGRADVGQLLLDPPSPSAVLAGEEAGPGGLGEVDEVRAVRPLRLAEPGRAQLLAPELVE